jgi:hypothetical protein
VPLCRAGQGWQLFSPRLHRTLPPRWSRTPALWCAALPESSHQVAKALSQKDLLLPRQLLARGQPSWGRLSLSFPGSPSSRKPGRERCSWEARSKNNVAGVWLRQNWLVERGTLFAFLVAFIFPVFIVGGCALSAGF